MISGKADFPDSKKLQPAPVDVKPNISGNVNSDLDKNESVNFLQNLIFPDENKKDVATENGVISENTYKTGYFLKIFLFLAISFIFLLVFLFVRKKNK